MTQPGIEPRSPGPLANTLPIWNTINKQYSLALNVAYCYYFKPTKKPPLIHNSIDNMIIVYAIY